jgi:hypothetical protein
MPTKKKPAPKKAKSKRTTQPHKKHDMSEAEPMPDPDEPMFEPREDEPAPDED